MLIKIFLIVLVAVALAFLIVKYLPLKLRWIVSVLCVIASVFLIYLIYSSVTLPIKFKQEKEKRYAKVIKQLKLIRDVQEKYRDFSGKFSNNEDTLVNFVKTGKLYLTQTLNVKKEIKVGELTKEISVIKIDTIGTEPVNKYFKDRNVNNLFSVPGLDNVKFDVVAKSIEKEGALVKNTIIEVFEAKVGKEKVLHDLDENEVNLELLRKENDQVKGKFISVGSLEKVTLKGNWPKSYDAEDILKKKKEKERLKKLEQEKKKALLEKAEATKATEEVSK